MRPPRLRIQTLLIVVAIVGVLLWLWVVVSGGYRAARDLWIYSQAMKGLKG